MKKRKRKIKQKISGYYTGIGSRKTPPKIQELMTKIASVLEKKGWVLRSGGANGADLAFENGVENNKSIFIPWKGFNNSDSPFYYDIESEETKKISFKIAEENHPGWKYLEEPVRKLMARNVFQVMGQNLDKNSSFVICWTPDGCESHETRTNKTGGTGLAISVASKLNIPIFNLKNESSLNRVIKLLEAS